MIPPEVRDAAERKLAPRRGESVPVERNVSVGQIVKIQSYPGQDRTQIARLGVVVAVDNAEETVRFLLATPAKEFATDLDAVVSSQDSGLPYDLLVQGELYGTIFEEQVVAQVAAVAPELALAADASLSSDGESLEGYVTGWPLGSAEDPRRTFKESELDDLDALVHECRRSMDGLAAEGGILDVSVLLPPAAGTDPDEAGDLFLEVLDLVSNSGMGTIKLPPYWLEDERLLTELQRWQSDFGLPASRILDRYVLTADDPVDSIDDEESPSAVGDIQAAVDIVMRKTIRGRGRKGSAVIDIYTTRPAWNRRHHKKFVTEFVEREGSSAVVRALARTLEEVPA